MKFDVELEERVKSAALNFLERGKAGWDVPHTLACVHWMKELLKYEKGNPKILIPAIYLHDVGYPKLTEDYGLVDYKEATANHMIIGEKIARSILRETPEFDGKEIREITHLIRIHDDLDEIKTHNEQLIFEADSLGQIDVDRVKPTFSREDYVTWLDSFERERVPKFKTQRGKQILNKLLPKAKAYFT